MQAGLARAQGGSWMARATLTTPGSCGSQSWTQTCDYSRRLSLATAAPCRRLPSLAATSQDLEFPCEGAWLWPLFPVVGLCAFCQGPGHPPPPRSHSLVSLG